MEFANRRAFVGLSINSATASKGKRFRSFISADDVHVPLPAPISQSNHSEAVDPTENKMWCACVPGISHLNSTSWGNNAMPPKKSPTPSLPSVTHAADLSSHRPPTITATASELFVKRTRYRTLARIL